MNNSALNSLFYIPLSMTNFRKCNILLHHNLLIPILGIIFKYLFIFLISNTILKISLSNFIKKKKFVIEQAQGYRSEYKTYLKVEKLYM